MQHRLVLDYTLSAGRLAPWLDGLRAGTAVGLSCDECGRVSFPPQRRCSCGAVAETWVNLPGTGTMVWRTDGPAESFALVRFDGVAALTVVRLQDAAARGDRGRLVAVPEGPPAQVFALDTPVRMGPA